MSQNSSRFPNLSISPNKKVSEPSLTPTRTFSKKQNKLQKSFKASSGQEKLMMGKRQKGSRKEMGKGGAGTGPHKSFRRKVSKGSMISTDSVRNINQINNLNMIKVVISDQRLKDGFSISQTPKNSTMSDAKALLRYGSSSKKNMSQFSKIQVLNSPTINLNMMEAPPKLNFHSTLSQSSNKSKGNSKMKYSLMKKLSMKKPGSKAALKTVMDKNKRNKEKSELYQSAVLEELGKNIYQKPMIIEQSQAKKTTEEKQNKKLKVFKMMAKTKLKNKSMEKNASSKNSIDEKTLQVNSKNKKNTTKEVSVNQTILGTQKSPKKPNPSPQNITHLKSSTLPKNHQNPSANILHFKKEKSTASLKACEESPKSKLKRLIDGNKKKPKTEEQKTFKQTLKYRNQVDNLTSIKTEKEIKNIKEIIEFPLKVPKALKNLESILTEQEKEELKYYDMIYYINMDKEAVERKFMMKDSIYYDDDKMDYRLIVGEHILYRYEIVDSLGKGSFGQVIKAFDHKHKRNIALKVIKNK